MKMTSPRKVKDVQKLTGKVAALNQFVSRATNKCLLFFKILRGTKDFIWTKECKEAFALLKRNLSTSPLLSKPICGETLLLYLAVSETTVSVALIREEGTAQLPVYYVSKWR